MAKLPRQLPRGIAPEILISQVKSTAPYLFDADSGGIALDRFPPASLLKQYGSELPAELSHFDYFKLCLSSHYSTCGTPVPTDVDNQIRMKLWPKELPLETALQMATLIIESHSWDFTQVSSRYSYGAPQTEWSKEPLSGQLGEWFTVACGAYCALLQYGEDSTAKLKRDELFAHIRDEVNRHSEIFGSLWRAGDGLGCLKSSANIAHNFGDLDRVMDMWALPAWDPLRLEFYKLATLPFDHQRNLRHKGRLWVAGELYKSPIRGSSMALENHRHYALRKPKCLREKRSFLVPNAPFFDDWGKQIAQGLMAGDGAPSEKTFEVRDALVRGWDLQPKTFAYGRALRGMIQVHPELELPGLKRTEDWSAIVRSPREEFEAHWAQAALEHMDEIPSRAE